MTAATSTTTSDIEQPKAPSTDALRAGATAVVSKLQRAGYEAYLAGGCVRDALLGLEPKDFDIATAAHPETVMGLFPGAVATGKSFGVVRVRCAGLDYEIATFRRDHDYNDGRRPESVTFTTAEEDASRRDFTINALFQDPIADCIHDFVDGRADIERRLIRCVGVASERFREDYLRMLRAIRFSAVLGFDIEPDTFAALQEHGHLITKISPERIQIELTRMLMEAPRPGDALLLLESSGLLKHLLPEIAVMRDQAQPPQFHPEGDVLIHTAIMLNLLEWRSVPLVYAVLLHDVGKPPTATEEDRIRFNGHEAVGAKMAATILRRLKLPNKVIDEVVHSVKNHMKFAAVPNMKRSTLRRFVGHDHFTTELELHRVDCLGSHGMLAHYEQVLAFREELAAEPVLPAPWLSGRDLIDEGLKPGPEMGRILHQLYTRQLEGEDATREEQLDWFRTAFL
jgi:poly(A) polymerase